ncbi:DUF2461 domain-containing protein [Mangrovimonas aestuarii]|uniref:DUF2461 domain-containing protein n=1 Tax=Mangrovimonas aestuarii TaxID=3018443 RepID=UPI002378C39C|nr:DUF2461 domain-containing protein [Mangrovimonas aestuarii]
MSTISPNVLGFLAKLKENNNRDWFNDNKSEYEKVHKDIKGVYNDVLQGLRQHDDVDKLKLFRIYRDVRFSKDKQPYKTHFGGSFHRVKPELRGGYYLHIAPNNESFIATGFWEPNKDDLLRIRKEFEMDDDEVRGIMDNSSFKSVWGNLQGDEVKTAPKGFSRDHKAIDLIKKKQHIFTKSFTDKEVLSTDFLSKIDGAFKTIRPYFDYMSSVLTTNLNGESII